MKRTAKSTPPVPPSLLTLMQTKQYDAIAALADGDPVFNTPISADVTVRPARGKGRATKISDTVAFPPICSAIVDNDLVLLKLLLKKGADVKAQFPSIAPVIMTNLLGMAFARRARIEIILALLDAGAPCNAIRVSRVGDKSVGETAISAALDLSGPDMLEVLAKLFEKGASISLFFKYDHERALCFLNNSGKMISGCARNKKRLEQAFLVLTQFYQHAITENIEVPASANLLTTAVEYGQLPLAEIMVKLGISPTDKYEFETVYNNELITLEMSGLLSATSKNDKNFIDYFLTIPNININARYKTLTTKGYVELTLLMIACINENIPLIERLLKLGANPCIYIAFTPDALKTVNNSERISHFGKKIEDAFCFEVHQNSALIYALETESREAVSIVLNAIRAANVDPNLKHKVISRAILTLIDYDDPKNLLPLFSEELTSPLLDNEFLGVYAHPLASAFARGSDNVCQSLIRLGVKVDPMQAPRPINFSSYERMPIVRSTKKDIERVASTHSRARQQIDACVLTEEIANTNTLPIGMLVPVKVALQNITHTRLAVSLNANPTTAYISSYGMISTPIAEASTIADPEFLIALLEQWKNKFSTCSLKGISPLVMSIVHNAAKCLRILLENAELLADDYLITNKQAALLLALQFDRINIIPILHIAGYSLDFTLDDGPCQGYPFLLFAEYANKPALFEALIKMGADIFLPLKDCAEENTFTYSCRIFKWQPFYLKSIIMHHFIPHLTADHPAKKYLNLPSASPLIAAILAKDISLLKMLLKAGFDCNQMEKVGPYKHKNAVLVAQETGCADLVEVMTAYINLNAKTEAGNKVLARTLAERLGFNAHGYTRPISSSESEDATLLEYAMDRENALIKSVKKYFNLINELLTHREKDAEKANARLHLCLFRFFEALRQLSSVVGVNSILSPTLIVDIRHLLRHQHPGLDYADYQKLAGLVKTHIEESINLLPLLTKKKVPNNPFLQWKNISLKNAKRIMDLQARPLINETLITRELTHLSHYLESLNAMPFLVMDDPYIQACEHSLFIIGECFQQAGCLNDPFLVDLITEIRTVSNTTAHEMDDEESFDKKFNPAYILYLVHHIVEQQDLLLGLVKRVAADCLGGVEDRVGQARVCN